MAENSWEKLLVRGPRGALVCCQANVATIFTYNDKWKDVFAYDQFVGDIVALKAAPWPKHMVPADHAAGDWTHDDTIRAGVWLSQVYGFSPSTSVVGEGIRVVAARKVVHPVRDWLNTIKWDRRKRADTFLIRLAGAEDTPYVRAVSKNFLIGAVARVMEPGVKVDTMPIFEGAQGIGKSTLLHDLVGEKWFMETNIEIGTKDAYQSLRRKWIVELGELDSMSRADVSKVKQFLTQRVDSYRPSYGHNVIDFPRQIVFAGTVNPEAGGYLKDNTGARRFLPVVLRHVNLAALNKERVQLWAEARYRYSKGEKWYFTDQTVITAAALIAEQRRQLDPWEYAISAWLEKTKWAAREGVTTHDVLTSALDLTLAGRSRTDEMRAASALNALGWSRVERVRRGGTVMRVHFPAVGLVTTSPKAPTPPRRSNVVKLIGRGDP